MRGNEKVIEQLNKALASELLAIVQYMTQAEMCRNWGYPQLGDRTERRAIEEMKHAEALIERIVFFDSIPNLAVSLKPQFGATVAQQFDLALKDELEAVHDYNEAIRVCMDAKDDGTRQLFESNLKDEERHVDYLEAQIHSIEEIGIGNYLSQFLESAK